MQPELDFKVIIPNFDDSKELSDIIKLDKDTNNAHSAELDRLLRKSDLISRTFW